MTSFSAVSQPKIILINWKKYYSTLPVKEFDEFMQCLKDATDTFLFKDFNTPHDICAFISQNIDNPYKLVFPCAGRTHGVDDPKRNRLYNCYVDMNICVDYIKIHVKDSKLMFYFIPQDIFFVKKNYNFWWNLASASTHPNIKLVLNLTDLDDYNINMVPRKVVFSKQVWGKYPKVVNPEEFLFWPGNYAYKHAFLPFNENPTNKVANVGTHEPHAYPLRAKIDIMLKHDRDIFHRIRSNIKKDRDVTSKKEVNTTFSRLLNSFLAVIYTSVFNNNKSCVLLKMHEILASGALCLVPNESVLLFEKMQMKNGLHFMSIDTTNRGTMVETIKYVTNPENRQIIDEIRKNGQEYCREKLGVKRAYDDFMKLFFTY